MLCKLNKNRIETYTIEPFEDSYSIELEQKLIELNNKHRMNRAGDVELIKSIVKTLITGISDFNDTLSAANMFLGFSRYAYVAYKPHTNAAENHAVNLLKMFDLHKDNPKSMDLHTTEMIIKGVEIATIADEFPREFSERFPGLLGLNNSRFVQILKSVKDFNICTNPCADVYYGLVFTVPGGGEIVFRLYIKYDEKTKCINLGLEFVDNSINAEMIIKPYITVYNDDDTSERAGYGVEINIPISLINYDKNDERITGIDLYKYTSNIFADLIKKYDLAGKMRRELGLEVLEEEIRDMILDD